MNKHKIFIGLIITVLALGFIVPVFAQQNNDTERDIQMVQQNNENNRRIKPDAKAVNGEEHRSTVANFVQSLIKVADRQKDGIGEQVRVIAQEQEQNQEITADQIESIQKRNKIKTFLIGTDYKNIGALRSEMVRVRNRINQLNGLLDSAATDEDKIALQDQITAMSHEADNIDAFLKANESKFSLFGWFVKLISPKTSKDTTVE